METVQNAPKPYTERELTELLRQAQEGSPEALDEFFSRLRERILALAKQAVWNIGLRVADAEDAAQETMLVVHEHLHEFQRWENVMRFARKTLRNKLGNYHQYRRYRDPLEIPLEKARALGRMDVVLEEIELQRILERALEELHRIRPHDALILRGVLQRSEQEGAVPDAGPHLPPFRCQAPPVPPTPAAYSPGVGGS
jgi:DNA-directed RNA polymerase specialized sigma24 family protein